MGEVRSFINGQALVRFGGRILIGIYEYESHSAILGMQEAKRTDFKVGDTATADEPVYENEVLLVFDNLHSVAIMQDALNRVEAVLKSHDYENKHEREETEV